MLKTTYIDTFMIYQKKVRVLNIKHRGFNLD